MTTRRMPSTKRALIASALTALVILPGLGLRGASAQLTEDTAVIDGSSLAAAAVAVGHVEPNLDFWPMYSSASIDNEASHGLSAAIWPGFLIDAFFWLYGFQTLERAALGISESQYPNPPHSTKGSSSTFLLSNFSQGCEFLFGPQDPATDNCRAVVGPMFTDPPGAVGRSESRSGRLTSQGSAQATRFAIPGIAEAAEAVSSTSARFVDGRTVSEASFTARDIRIGTDLRIDVLQAVSRSSVGGAPGTSESTGRLRITGARWGTVDVDIDDQGVHVTGDRTSDALNEALAAQGFEVRLVQGRRSADEDGETADTATGGLLVRVFRDRAEEAFPMQVREAREAACRSAEESIFNREITRIRVSEPNPLFGRIPFAPLPERAEVEQSVPPPTGCPFLNRSFEVAFVLGFTNASARLSPVPAFDFDPTTSIPEGGFVDPSLVSFGDGASFAFPGGGATTPGGTGASVLGPARDREAVSLVAAFSEKDVAARVKTLYVLMALIAGLGLAGRAVLRQLSSP
jgi:hypothetical protein